jgi:hypothetical protein
MLVKRKEFNSEIFNSQEIEFKLDSFLEYLALTNKLIDKNLRKHLTEYNKADTFSKTLYDELDIYIKGETLNLYYSSILITLYAFLEQAMYRLCKSSEENNVLKIDDISGKGIIKYKKYLEKVVCIDFSKINNEWEEITRYNHLRNIFVHKSNSTIKITDSKNKINAIKKIKSLKITRQSNQYIIDFENDKPIKHFIEIIRSFLSKIMTLKL